MSYTPNKKEEEKPMENPLTPEQEEDLKLYADEVDEDYDIIEEVEF